LWDSGRRLRDHLYVRLATLWCDSLLPEDEVDAERLFNMLVDCEVEQGTTLEALLARLPVVVQFEVFFWAAGM
jgi:hypothetical protein